jgi:hypothetical protein
MSGMRQASTASLIAAVLAALVAGCTGAAQARRTAQTPTTTESLARPEAPRNLPAWRGGDHRSAYDPAVLARLVAAVAAQAEAGKAPVAVFDLDHTLLDNRPRTLRILQDLVRDHAADDRAAAAVSALRRGQVYYSADETVRKALQREGLADEAFVKRLAGEWGTKFFSNDYLEWDVPVAGAVEFTRALADAGAVIVYLTGRDAPNMEAGTRRSLEKCGFPLGEKTRLILKPDKATDDRAFKRDVAGDIAKLGVVTLAVENEPMNLTCMCCDWPEAELLYLDTDHSPRFDDKLPPGHAAWVGDFVMARRAATPPARADACGR